ncbi:MAG: cbb3-type cytochrome c oxidase subunit 3 [Melioribacteraceae bacterium]|jgi:cbb3-type cytochrome oxidase subunit 3|nr:cbb3-type cytochrome c oxidase subunit 3 [Melioribacteraceae bacterium]
MISKYLSSIEGISIFPVIGLILFFGLFLFLIVWIVRLDKKYLAQMGNLPFENNDEIKNKIETKYETKQ